jgi:hypothetical protein
MLTSLFQHVEGTSYVSTVSRKASNRMKQERQRTKEEEKGRRGKTGRALFVLDATQEFEDCHKGVTLSRKMRQRRERGSSGKRRNGEERGGERRERGGSCRDRRREFDNSNEDDDHGGRWKERRRRRKQNSSYCFFSFPSAPFSMSSLLLRLLLLLPLRLLFLLLQPLQSPLSSPPLLTRLDLSLKVRDDFGWVGGAEEGGTGDDDVGACVREEEGELVKREEREKGRRRTGTSTAPDGSGTDTAVDLNVLRRESLTKLRDLRHTSMNEGLSTGACSCTLISIRGKPRRESRRTGNDSHDEHHVDALTEFVTDRGGGGGGGDGDGGAHAGGVDERDEFVGVFCEHERASGKSECVGG